MKRAIIAALCACAASTTWSQEPEDAVVVTATRFPEARSQTLQPVNIITAEDIAASGQQTLAEVLQTLGGVEVTSTGGFGQPTGVFIRGANSNHTLVLVDGMRISSATTGTTALENIPLGQIERIEIAPGELSSLYGSDAIGGVIQIFTKSAKYSPGVSASAGYGTYDTRSVDGSVSRTVGNADMTLALGYFETRGFDATKPTIPFDQHNPDRDGYRNANGSAKIAYHLDRADEFGLTAFQSDGSTHFDTGPTTDDVNHQTLSAYSLYSSNQITGVWKSLVRVGESTDDSTLTGAFPGFFRTTQPQLTWQNNFKVGAGTAVAGAEYLTQNVASDTAYTQTYRRIRSAFAGYTGELDGHGWQVNLRNDSNSQFGDHTTGLLGYAYRLTSDLRLRASTGTAFKAPTFNDLYFPNTGFGSGNPNLRPERSRSKEAGLNYQMGTGRLSATYFDNRITDLIVFDTATFPPQPQNLNRASVKGTELGYEGSLAGVHARAQLTLQRPVDAATGLLLQRRARKYGSAAVSDASGPWKLGAELVASGARFDSTDEAPDTRMHGYALLNLTAGYALDRDWSVRARWNNVFDREYELAQNFNTPGSNVFVALQYQAQ